MHNGTSLKCSPHVSPCSIEILRHSRELSHRDAWQRHGVAGELGFNTCRVGCVEAKDLATFFQKQAPWKSDASFEDDEDDMIHLFLRIITDTTLFTPLNTLR
jgi:hypothetical protein